MISDMEKWENKKLFQTTSQIIVTMQGWTDLQRITGNSIKVLVEIYNPKHPKTIQHVASCSTNIFRYQRFRPMPMHSECLS